MAEREALLPEPPPQEAPLPGTLGRLRPPRLNVLLFIATGISALAMGSGLYDSSQKPTLEQELIWGGLFAVALLAILLAHEMGHFVLARKHGVDASWPFFIPAPMLSFIGTLGAVIRLRSLPRSRRALIDIAVAGPLAGFLVTLPVIAIGLSISPIVPADPDGPYWSLARMFETRLHGGGWIKPGAWSFGQPLALRLLERIVVGQVPAGQMVALHPVAVAGWFGLLLTALNLLPLGQLDGGHLLYGASPRLHRALASPLAGVLVGLGVFTPFAGWLLWGLVAGLFFNRHPRLSEPEEKLDWGRRALLLAGLVLMILSFTPAPLLPFIVN